MHTCFIDLVKAFDSLDWEVMFTVLDAFKLPSSITEVLKRIYINGLYVVDGAENCREPFKCTSGVKQGCVLSPSIFILVLDILIKVALEDDEGHLQ